MRTKPAERRWSRVFLWFALIGLLAADAAAVDRKRLEQALAKITVLEGSSPIARATGFAWHQRDWVVTSLHAMRNNATYQVERPGHTTIWTAVPIGHLAAHDLVLLELQSARGQKLSDAQKPSWTPLTSASQLPSFGEDIFAFGYYDDTPKPRFVKLTVESNEALGPKIPQKHAKSLQACKIPDASLPVLHFMTGSLLPGYSGAPLVNKNGQVVAIGDGGLENGAIDVSWGIHARHLEGLKGAVGTGIPASVAACTQHFSAGLGGGNHAKSVQYGPYEFVLKKTRTFAELRASVDNPQDLELQLSDLDNIDMSSFRYDIYQDLNYGLVIAVPAGRDLTVGPDDTLQVQVGKYQIFYDAGAEPGEIRELMSSPNIHQALTEELRADIGLPPAAVQLDPETSSCDRSMDGGLIATLALDIVDPATSTAVGFSFIKVAMKGELYLASGFAFDDLMEQLPRFKQAGCDDRTLPCGRIDPASPCATVCDWVHMFTSVYLTSFSEFKASGRGCALSNVPDVFAATDRARTVHGVINWANFDPNAIQLAQQGLFLTDMEVLMEGGQWVLAGVHQPIPVQTFWRHAYNHAGFTAEVQSLAQQGYQLKDLEVSWDGDFKYAGVFQPDFRATSFFSYHTWDQLLTHVQQSEQAGWNLIDLEVPWGGGQFFIMAVYQYGAGPSTYRFGDWNNIVAATRQLAAQGWNLTDLETYWDGQVQWFAGVYSPTAPPALTWIADWVSFEQQVKVFESQGYYLDDLEIFPAAGGRWALGVFH